MAIQRHKKIHFSLSPMKVKEEKTEKTEPIKGKEEEQDETVNGYYRFGIWACLIACALKYLPLLARPFSNLSEWSGISVGAYYFFTILSIITILINIYIYIKEDLLQLTATNRHKIYGIILVFLVGVIALK